MTNQITQPDNPGNMPSVSGPTSLLKQQYEGLHDLIGTQPAIIQRFLETQAAQIAEALQHHHPQIRFNLPDKIVCDPAKSGSSIYCAIPQGQREQLVGGLINRITRTDIRNAFRQRLAELESSNNRGVSTSARLIRHVVAQYLVHQMLPSGRTVIYTAVEGEEIPSLPMEETLEPGSAITASTDAIAEEGDKEEGRGELLVPYVEYARRFYLPQWVAFDDNGTLLVNSVNEAEAHIASMQNYLEILHAAVALAPYMVADPDYQQKRYGMLGQLINQGRALAAYVTQEIIDQILQRAKTHDLNRGLSLSLPYFDDQDLSLKTHSFDVIPAGRIMFVPAFVVRSAREEQVKIAQDTRLSPSTRKYLLIELANLENSFDRV